LVTTRPRIAIAGMAIESSTFSPHRAGDRDFHKYTGRELVERYDVARDELAQRAEWIGIFYARSIPGGALERQVYEDYRERICAGLLAAHREAPLDGLFLDLHGAMSVEGMDDAEGDLITAIRAAIGNKVMISASLDLHGNVSPVLVANVDLITCYRLAPHEDAWETKNRAARNLFETLTSGARPVRAWIPIPILLPGEKTSTRVEPAKSLYGQIAGIAARPGIIDASIWVGYAWADEPRCHAAVVVQGTDEGACVSAAEKLAAQFWRARKDFQFVGPPGTLDEALAAALEATEKPYLISDSGDNPGAGGTGDVTWTLSRILQRPEFTAVGGPTTFVASIFDQAALAQLRTYATGDRVDVRAGGRVTPSPSQPVRIQGELISLTERDPDAGAIAVIRVGGLHVIITEFRKAFHAVADFAALGLEPATADIIVTKIGYLEPTLYEIARGWTLALTPGGVDQDLERLGHKRIQRPMFPFDIDAPEPDLRARVFAGPARPRH